MPKSLLGENRAVGRREGPARWLRYLVVMQMDLQRAGPYGFNALGFRSRPGTLSSRIDSPRQFGSEDSDGGEQLMRLYPLWSPASTGLLWGCGTGKRCRHPRDGYPARMRIGYQGEGRSYSDQAACELFPDAERIGFAGFAAAFHALRDGEVNRLVLPIENSTTGSVLPVLDRLTRSRASIVGEHLVEVRHALIGVKGATLDGVRTVRSHPQALAQADDRIEQAGWEPVAIHDTAGAVRQIADLGDVTATALAPPETAQDHGVEVLAYDFMDRAHNTTRFVVLEPEEPEVAADANKTSFMFATAHLPGALGLALVELGLRGANLTRLESRPAEAAWKYRFYADMLHRPGPEGVREILEPRPATLAELHLLGTYRAAPSP